MSVEIPAAPPALTYNGKYEGQNSKDRRRMEEGTFASTVSGVPYESHGASLHRKLLQLEAVGHVPMCCLRERIV